jgi:hypothetical protein
MRKSICAGLLVLATLTSCGGEDAGGSTGDDDTAAAPAPSSLQPAPESSAPETSAAAAPVNLQGNAARNPACKLLSIGEVEAAAGLTVIGILGLPADTTNPDKHSESCTWFLEPKVVQSSLVVQYTRYGEPPADVIAYYPQVVDQGLATAVPNLGTVSKINGHVLDTIFQRTEIHVTLLTHAEATSEDQRSTVGLMRTVMPRIKQ